MATTFPRTPAPTQEQVRLLSSKQLCPLEKLTAENAPWQLVLRGRLAWRCARLHSGPFRKAFAAALHGLGVDLVGLDEGQAIAATAPAGAAPLFITPEQLPDSAPDGVALVWCGTASAVIARSRR